MNVFRGTLPSPAMVLAAIALVLALAGTAIAGPDVLSRALTKPKVRQIADKEIQKLAPSLSVANAKAADTAKTADTANGLSDGAVRAADLGPIMTVSNTSATFAQSTSASSFAQCPPGTVVLSGGGFASAAGVLTEASRKSDPNGWQYNAFNASGSPQTITAVAYCLS